MATAASPQPDQLSARLMAALHSSQVKIPPYPAVAAKLQEVVRNNGSLAQVTKILSADATLTAGVLRRASSAMLRGGGSLTLEAAVSRVGLDELVRLAFAVGVGGAAAKSGPLAVLRRDQWRRSLLAAMICKELAPRRGIERDEAFLAGLLHDFGAIVVMACLEAIPDLPTLSEPLWGDMIDELHIEFGNALADRWNLPPPLANALAHHHSPDKASDAYRKLVQLVATADAAIQALDCSPEEGTAVLASIDGLDHQDQMAIGTLLPKVADHMANFEPPAPTRQVTTAVQRVQREGLWPARFDLSAKNNETFTGCTMGPSAFTFESARAFTPGWLAELSLECEGDSMTMLANVHLCYPSGKKFVVVAQPFALAGDDKATWMRIISRTRPAPDPR